MRDVTVKALDEQQRESQARYKAQCGDDPISDMSLQIVTSDETSFALQRGSVEHGLWVVAMLKTGFKSESCVRGDA